MTSRSVSEHAREEGSVDEARAFGRRLREVRCGPELNLREAAGLAGPSVSLWVRWSAVTSR